MLSSIDQYLILLLRTIKLILDKTLSNIMFTEPINKSDQTGLKQQEYFLKEEMKITQSKNDWEDEEVVFY